MKLLFIALSASLLNASALDIVELQQQVLTGDAAKAHAQLSVELKRKPNDARLLYNRGVAAYAAGRYEDALVDFDLVQDSKNKKLAHKSRFQKGNAQFRLGYGTRDYDPEATIARWKQSLSEYNELLKIMPEDLDATKNRNVVRAELLKLIKASAKENLERGMQPQRPPDSRINALRWAIEQFQDAQEIEPNETAREGEEIARDELAKLLANEGEKRSMTQNMVNPSRNEPAIPRPDTNRIQEGVDMLQDAHDLKPNDQEIAQKLEAAKNRLADALTQQARIYQSVEPRIPRVDEKLGLLRLAMELVERALEQNENHQGAKETLEQIKRRLAEIHEQEGDQQQMMARNSQLEQQAQSLSQALDHYQQAQQLQPNDQRLPQKSQQTQGDLERALEQLGNKLMQPGGEQESTEEQISRMEGAQQAFNELQGLKPSTQTAEKARQAGEKAEQLRQQLAEKGQPMQQPGGDKPGQAQMQPRDEMQGPPMDTPPRLDRRGRSGPYQSGAMNRNLRDY